MNTQQTGSAEDLSRFVSLQQLQLIGKRMRRDRPVSILRRDHLHFALYGKPRLALGTCRRLIQQTRQSLWI